MKPATQMIALLSVLALSTGMALPTVAQNRAASKAKAKVQAAVESVEEIAEQDSAAFEARSLEELLTEFNTLPTERILANKMTGPWIFTGFRHVRPTLSFKPAAVTSYPGMKVATNDSTDIYTEELEEFVEGPTGAGEVEAEKVAEEVEEKTPELKVLTPGYMPEWLKTALRQNRWQEDFMYSTMVYYPYTIDYAYWDLPEPPVLPDDDVSFQAYMAKLDLPDVETGKAILPEEELKKIHWLHKVDAMAQFSQAYVSSNWYQGGNDHLSLLLGANWNVQLNQVYHPKLLFQSNLSYKLGLYSTPQDQVHRYAISEDVLQWNLNTGLKALKKWYYSFNAQFKTQIFKNYQSNSHDLKASFLSPGDFNMGLGMSYSNKKPNLEFTATLSPLSYNLKTCITDKIDHGQFNIEPDRYTHSEFGSNAEFNMSWNIKYNLSYKTRLFLFSDYSYFLADWEHTINFQFNKFLSTQIYVHLRYDTSTEVATKWKHFMMREVLSFGLTYAFSTK